MIEWTVVQDDKLYRIHQFDDGKERYSQYVNKWSIIATWRGKVRLLNVDGNTCLSSISRWKTLEIPIEPAPELPTALPQ